MISTGQFSNKIGGKKREPFPYSFLIGKQKRGKNYNDDDDDDDMMMIMQRVNEHTCNRKFI